MEVQSVTIPYASASDVFTLWKIGDIHAGTRQCSEKKFDQDIAAIDADPLARWVGMGDYGEFINFHDPRFDFNNLSPWVLKQMSGKPLDRKGREAAGFTVAGIQRDWLEVKLKPIADKCLGLLYGNHEDVIRVRYECETALGLADRLKVLNLGYDCYLRLLFCGGGDKHAAQSLVEYLHHGFVTSRLAGGTALGLERMFMQHPQARIIVLAHGHRRQCIPSEAFNIKWNSKQPFSSVNRYAAMTGPYLRSYSEPGDLAGYAERKGLPLTTMGAIRFTYKPEADFLEAIT
jgi:hypothetical protein